MKGFKYVGVKGYYKSEMAFVSVRRLYIYTYERKYVTLCYGFNAERREKIIITFSF